MIADLPKFQTGVAQTRRFPRELVTLRVVQFALKIAHLAISME